MIRANLLLGHDELPSAVRESRVAECFWQRQVKCGEIEGGKAEGAIGFDLVLPYEQSVGEAEGRKLQEKCQ